MNRVHLQHERGVALITVIVVLMALVIIATPFSVSMRNHNESATDLLSRTRARSECEALRNLALEQLKQTHPVFDTLSPHADQAKEWDVKPDELPLGFSTRDPKGKIWSLRIDDLQGRINLNSASIYLIANLLGLRTHLSEDMDQGTTSIEVVKTEGFPQEGLLWLDGEGMIYGTKGDDGFEDLDREFELPNLPHNRRGFHPSGAEVLDFRAFLLATYCYKWLPGRLSTFPTVESMRNIASFGEMALRRIDLDRIEDRITVRSGLPSGRRFVNPQRVLNFGQDEYRDTLVVDNGRYMGTGSIVRIQSEEEIHYSLVLRSEPMGDRTWLLVLQEPVPFEVDEDLTGKIDVLARHPVNINTAPPEVLEALLLGLTLTKEGKRWIKAVEAGGIQGIESKGIFADLGLDPDFVQQAEEVVIDPRKAN
jgi:type II secretory pathway component PulK